MEKEVIDFLKKYYLGIIVVFSSFIFLVIFVFFYFYYGPGEESLFPSIYSNKRSSVTTQEKQELVYPKELLPGTVGEAAGKTGETADVENQTGIKEEFGQNISLPAVIFTTRGIILKIQNDSILVKGTGSNFADGKERMLTLKFTDDAIVRNPKIGSSWRGFEGLKHLEADMEILIKGVENIRGKTEFTVQAIIVL